MKLKLYPRVLCGALLSGLLFFGFAPKGHANVSYEVTINIPVSSPIDNGDFSLDVGLFSGSQINPANANNTVTLSNFVVTGGSFGGATFSAGGESGSMGSSVTLSLTSANNDNELAQQIEGSPTQITFEVTETANSDSPAPDSFDLALLDSGLANVATTDPSGADTLVFTDLSTSETPGSVDYYQTTAGSEAPNVIAVPEPAPVAALLIGISGILLCGRGRFRRFAK